MQYTYDIKSGMLQLRENEIPLRKWSGDTAHLRTLQGTPNSFLKGVSEKSKLTPSWINICGRP